MSLQQVVERRLIVRRVFANRCVRAASGFTPRIRSWGKAPRLVKNSASSFVKISLVTTARLYRSRNFKQSASTSAVLPDPTGPRSR